VWVDTDEPEVTPGVATGVFHAFNNDAAFTIVADGTQRKCKLSATTFDKNSWFDTTNWRYVPKVAGYYHFDAACTLVDPLNAGDGFFVFLLKNNGAESRRLCRLEPASADAVGGGGSGVFFANGSTDYFEVFVNMASSGSPARRIYSGDGTYLSGYYLGT
jgi:hypothetical protein